MSWQKIDMNLYGEIQTWEHQESGAILSITTYRNPRNEGSYQVTESLRDELNVIATTETLSEAEEIAEEHRQ